MDLTKDIKKMLVDKDMTSTQLAKKIETSQPNLSKKMANNSYSVTDLEKIAAALDMVLDIRFKEAGD